MKDFLKTIFCLNCQTQLGGWQRHYPLSPSKCDLISSDVVWSDRSFHHLVQFHVLFSPYVFVKTLKAMQHILWLRQAFWGQQHGAQWNPRLKRWSPKIGLFSNDAFQLQDFLLKEYTIKEHLRLEATGSHGSPDIWKQLFSFDSSFSE